MHMEITRIVTVPRLRIFGRNFFGRRVLHKHVSRNVDPGQEFFDRYNDRKYPGLEICPKFKIVAD